MMSAIAYNLSYYNIQHHLSTQEKKACVLFFVVASVRGCFGAIRGAARKRSFASLPRRPSQQERTRPTDGGSSRRSSSSVIYLPRGRISATTTRRDRSKEEIHRRGVVRPRRRRPYAVHLRRDRRVFFFPPLSSSATFPGTKSRRTTYPSALASELLQRPLASEMVADLVVGTDRPTAVHGSVRKNTAGVAPESSSSLSVSLRRIPSTTPRSPGESAE
mmetsp:Transcript_1273/g.3091  ORF Transcript_1273/g.3091 Transcript_1273/m.3091 type:complete len:218 (-) Transcript_1273:455-1108(-)